MKKNIHKCFEGLEEYFSPRIIDEVDDMYVKIARIKGEFPWHNHESEDEMFFILEGQMMMHIKNEEPFAMNPGELFVVPRGVVHRVWAESECRIMLIEKKSTLHTGNLKTELTRSIEEQKKPL